MHHIGCRAWGYRHRYRRPSTAYPPEFTVQQPPIDLVIYERDSLDVRREKRIAEDDEYFRKLSSAWSDALRSAFAKIEELKL